jgi:uncharacterized membrane protein YgcG
VNQLKDKLRSGLGKIQADDNLKNNTMAYLSEKINEDERSSWSRSGFKLVLACISLMFLVLIGGLSYNLYFTPASYVDLDANPSIGITVNRFGRVVGSEAYNDDGYKVLEGVNIRFRTYIDAVDILLDRIILKEHLLEHEFISITVQVNDYTVEGHMLEGINQRVEESLLEHHLEAHTEVFSVSECVRINAHKHNLTPARYLAITELKGVEPSITFSCPREYRICCIRERARNRDGSCIENEGNGRDNTHRSEQCQRIDQSESYRDRFNCYCEDRPNCHCYSNGLGGGQCDGTGGNHGSGSGSNQGGGQGSGAGSDQCDGLGGNQSGGSGSGAGSGQGGGSGSGAGSGQCDCSGVNQGAGSGQCDGTGGNQGPGSGQCDGTGGNHGPGSGQCDGSGGNQGAGGGQGSNSGGNQGAGTGGGSGGNSGGNHGGGSGNRD